MDRIFDLAIVGGGVNGCGIARDAAGRGNSVFLCEMNDLASGTSSWSTKLVHGGLRYLEYYEFRLVREALIEHLDDLEDLYLAERTLDRIRSGDEQTIPLEDVLKRHALED